MRISDWSSDVYSSDLQPAEERQAKQARIDARLEGRAAHRPNPAEGCGSKQQGDEPPPACGETRNRDYRAGQEGKLLADVGELLDDARADEDHPSRGDAERDAGGDERIGEAGDQLAAHHRLGFK